MQTALHDPMAHIGPIERSFVARLLAARARMSPPAVAAKQLETPADKTVRVRDQPSPAEVESPSVIPDTAVEVTTCNGQVVWVSPREIRMADEKLRRATGGKISIERIQQAVACTYNISSMDMRSARRTANIVRPRQVAMYLAKTLTLRSLPEIGRRFGGRDHTTVLHAVRKIEALVSKDVALSDEVELLKRQLQD